jgi:hypothetical protein
MIRRFLLAQLHVELLSKKQDRKSVRRALQTLPKTLDDTYGEAMKRINYQDEEDAQLAMKVLSWISFALRPLSILGMSRNPHHFKKFGSILERLVWVHKLSSRQKKS